MQGFTLWTSLIVAWALNQTLLASLRSVMMHLHLLKPQTEYIGGGGTSLSSGGAAVQRYGGASGKGHAEVILVYSVPTKQVCE